MVMRARHGRICSTLSSMLSLKLRSQELRPDATGHNMWSVTTIEKAIPAREIAIVVCDMWDNHWSRGAAERVNAMAPYMNEVLHAARAKGVRIIHAPSETMDL